MAESYQSDEEQIEALKKWWDENGKSTVIAIVVSILAVFGWQGWQKQQQADMDAASSIYQNLLAAANGANGEPSKEQLTTANHLAETLKSDFSGSSYAQYAALYKAKFAVANSDLESAEQELQWVIDSNPDQALMVQTRLRLARVLYSLERYDDALGELGHESTGFESAFDEVRGDILLAKGEKEEALSAYQQARSSSAADLSAPRNPVLDLKIQQLESTDSASTAAANDSQSDTAADEAGE